MRTQDVYRFMRSKYQTQQDAEKLIKLIKEVDKTALADYLQVEEKYIDDMAYYLKDKGWL